MQAIPSAEAPRQNRHRGDVSFKTWLLLVALANTALFQWPLYRLAAGTRTALDVYSGLALSSLFVLQLLVSITILGIAGIVSLRLLKILCVMFVLGNSIALYFIVQYNVMLDASMMGNVLHTNASEAWSYAHPELLLYVVCFGILPAVLVSRTRIAPSSRMNRTVFLLVTLIAGAGWLYANAQSWLWIDKNAKQFGGLILPWSYSFNAARYLGQEAALHRQQDLLPELGKVNGNGAVVVLVIGESARAQNFSLYGYRRDTNPLLKKSGVIALAGAHACATYTTAAVRCMLSPRGAAGVTANDEPLTSYLHRYGIEVIWRTNNFGEPAMQVDAYERADDLRARCGDACARAQFDEVLLQGLAQRLGAGATGSKTLVVLHQAGSHGPQYFKKYPPEFEQFKPACRSVELQGCSHEELVNAYDNTIVYNDFFLDRLITMLKSLKDRPSVMIYMSDHGESLGEHGLYLHGVPMAVAPDFQTSVPLLVWMSDSFLRTRPSTYAASDQVTAGLSQGVVFHSVLGALGLTSQVYLPEQDLFGPATRNANNSNDSNDYNVKRQ